MVGKRSEWLENGAELPRVERGEVLVERALRRSVGSHLPLVVEDAVIGHHEGDTAGRAAGAAVAVPTEGGKEERPGAQTHGLKQAAAVQTSVHSGILR